MKVIESYVVWNDAHQELMMMYMCQSINGQEIAYYAQHEGQLWKLSDVHVKQLLKTNQMVPNE